MKNMLKILCSGLLLLCLAGCSSSDDEPDIPPPGGDETTDGMVIYEANPALFGETQALNALTSQLSRIKKLETNVLWLMPIFQQGEKKSVGSPYCVKDYRGINPAYGTLADLQALVSKAHSEGMLVILGSQSYCLGPCLDHGTQGLVYARCQRQYHLPSRNGMG